MQAVAVLRLQRLHRFFGKLHLRVAESAERADGAETVAALRPLRRYQPVLQVAGGGAGAVG